MAKTEPKKAGEGGIQRLSLSTVGGARRTLSRVIKDLHSDNVELEKYRGLVYGITQLVAFFKLENEMDLEKRLAALEATVNTKGEKQ